MRRLALAAVLLCWRTGGLAAEGLDGSRWRMKFRAEKTWLPIWKADGLSFDAGRFHSVDCESYGFSPAPYKTVRGSQALLWTGQLANDQGEVTVWQGALRGDRMEGSFVWRDSNGRFRRYIWKAKKRR